MSRARVFVIIRPASLFIDVTMWIVGRTAAFFAESLGLLWGYAIGETLQMDRRLAAFRQALAEQIIDKPRHPWDNHRDDDDDE